jgi:HPt (histidine-containing phosphotransfer) domain-containing protein
MNESDVLDAAAFEALVEMVGGDPEFVAEMIDTYLDETPTLIAGMRSSVDAGNSAELRRAAHSLKSNSATFGAMALADICQRLEELGKSGVVDGVDTLVAQCATEYDRVEQALRRARPET